MRATAPLTTTHSTTMFDIFIIIVLIWAIYSGWRNGFISEIISLGGHLAGLFIAAIAYSVLGKYLAVEGSRVGMITSIGAFFILWIIVPIAFGLIANTLTRAIKPLGLTLVNRVGGAAVSVAKFTILLSCAFAAMSALGILNQQKAAESRLYTPLKGILAGAVDWAIDDEIRPLDPAQKTTTAVGDTVWIDVPKAKKDAESKSDEPNNGIQAERPAKATTAND